MRNQLFMLALLTLCFMLSVSAESDTIATTLCMAKYKTIATIRTFSQDVPLSVSFIPNRLLLKSNIRHTHNSGLEGKRDYAFMDAGIVYRTKKKVEFTLDVANIFNTKTFVSRSNTDLVESYTLYQLRPISVIIGTHIVL